MFLAGANDSVSVSFKKSTAVGLFTDKVDGEHYLDKTGQLVSITKV